MKGLIALVVAVVAWPVTGQPTDNESRVTELAVESLPQVIHGMKHPETFPFELRAFLLSDLTVGEEPEVVDADLRRFHSDPIAEELADSYSTNARAPRRIAIEHPTDIRVGPVDAFVIGDESYDWPSLQAASPDTNVVVRMSRPAMDRLETYAVVRFEFLTPHGRAWAAHAWFEKQASGSWEKGRMTIGHLWPLPGATLETPVLSEKQAPPN